MSQPDPFARLIPEARAFLTELAANNTRDWFTAHKTRYETELKAPAQLLLDQIAHDLAPGLSLKPKLFRAQRDVRFSKDKTPYHTYLHMLWSTGSDPQGAPGLFFGISPDYVTLGGGVMGFAGASLDRWRKMLDTADGEALASDLTQLADKGYTLRDPDLKRVPAPYAADHPRADLLRRKGLVAWRELPPADWPRPLACLTDAARDLSRLLQLLGRIA